MKKTRNLTPIQYFAQIQFEYMSCVIRSKIAVSNYWKTFYKPISEKKKKSIIAFSDRNSNLPSILNDTRLYDEMWNGLLKSGFPSLSYKDDIHKKTLQKIDFINFYSKDSDALILPTKEVVKIKSCSFENKTVTIKRNNEVLTYSSTDILRIL